MPSDRENRDRRLELIREIVASEPVRSQEELVGKLAERGLEVTQSSVSRDLRELAVAKLRGRYVLPAGPDAPEADVPDLTDELADLLRSVAEAGPHLLVVRTGIGAATRAALALDRAALSEIVGTVAGDDTFFVATASAKDQRRVKRFLLEAMTQQEVSA